MRPTCVAAHCANHIAPSGPTVIPTGPEAAVRPVLNSLMVGVPRMPEYEFVTETFTVDVLSVTEMTHPLNGGGVEIMPRANTWNVPPVPLPTTPEASAIAAQFAPDV